MPEVSLEAYETGLAKSAEWVAWDIELNASRCSDLAQRDLQAAAKNLYHQSVAIAEDGLSPRRFREWREAVECYERFRAVAQKEHDDTAPQKRAPSLMEVKACT